MSITDVYRISHPKIIKNTFFLGALGTVSRIDHMLRYEKVLRNMKFSWPQLYETKKQQSEENKAKSNIWRSNIRLLNNLAVRRNQRRNKKN